MIKQYIWAQGCSRIVNQEMKYLMFSISPQKQVIGSHKNHVIVVTPMISHIIWTSAQQNLQ